MAGDRAKRVHHGTIGRAPNLRDCVRRKKIADVFAPSWRQTWRFDENVAFRYTFSIVTRASRTLSVPALALILTGACDSGPDSQANFGNGGAFMEEDVPAGACGSSSGGDQDGNETAGSDSGGNCDLSLDAPTDGVTFVDACSASLECPPANVCVAVFDRDERMAFACRPSCVPTMDDRSWCADSQACCDPGAVCSPRGYCLIPEAMD